MQKGVEQYSIYYFVQGGFNERENGYNFSTASATGLKDRKEQQFPSKKKWKEKYLRFPYQVSCNLLSHILFKTNIQDKCRNSFTA